MRLNHDEKLSFLKLLYSLVFQRVEFYYSLAYKASVLSLANVGVVLGWKLASEGYIPDVLTKISVTIAMFLLSIVLFLFLKGILYWSQEYGALQYKIETIFKGYDTNEYIADDALFPPTGEYYGIPTSPGSGKTWLIYGIPLLPWIVATFILWTWQEGGVPKSEGTISNEVVECQADEPMEDDTEEKAFESQTHKGEYNSERNSGYHEKDTVVEMETRIQNSTCGDSLPIK